MYSNRGKSAFATNCSAGTGDMIQTQTTHELNVARFFSVVGIVLSILLFDLILSLSASNLPAGTSTWTNSDFPVPRDFRATAHSGSLAAMRTGAGTGVRVQMRGGRTASSFARRTQTGTPSLNSIKLQVFVPICMDCIEATTHAFLIRLFFRNCLPSRAGPHKN